MRDAGPALAMSADADLPQLAPLVITDDDQFFSLPREMGSAAVGSLDDDDGRAIAQAAAAAQAQRLAAGANRLSAETAHDDPLPEAARKQAPVKAVGAASARRVQGFGALRGSAGSPGPRTVNGPVAVTGRLLAELAARISGAAVVVAPQVPSPLVQTEVLLAELEAEFDTPQPRATVAPGDSAARKAWAAASRTTAAAATAAGAQPLLLLLPMVALLAAAWADLRPRPSASSSAAAGASCSAATRVNNALDSSGGVGGPLTPCNGAAAHDCVEATDDDDCSITNGDDSLHLGAPVRAPPRVPVPPLCLTNLQPAPTLTLAGLSGMADVVVARPPVCMKAAALALPGQAVPRAHAIISHGAVGVPRSPGFRASSWQCARDSLCMPLVFGRPGRSAGASASAAQLPLPVRKPVLRALTHRAEEARLAHVGACMLV
jgi:hypothetical protein